MPAKTAPARKSSPKTSRTYKTKAKPNKSSFWNIKRTRMLIFILLFANIGALTILFTSAASGDGFSQKADDVQFNNINATRKSAGRKALSRSKCLTDIARFYAKQMGESYVLFQLSGKSWRLAHSNDTTSGYYSEHYDYEKQLPFQCGAMEGGENVGWGGYSSTASAAQVSQNVYNEFMKSPTHKANILSTKMGRTNVTHVGVGTYATADRLFVVQIFSGCWGKCDPRLTAPPTLVGEPNGATSEQETSLPTCSLSASASTINAGQSTTLSWSSSNATSAYMNNGIGAIPTSGSKAVSPTVNTTYTATFSNAAGSKNCSKSITVNNTTSYPVPTCSLSASATTINAGQSTTLSWSSNYATSAYMNNNIGAIPTSGSRTVSPSSSTTYTATFSGSGGTKSCSRSITVNTSTGGTTQGKYFSLGSKINPGTTVYSSGGKYYLAMYYGGKLAYKRASDNYQVFDSRTGGYDGSYGVFQSDGNFVVYKPDGRYCHASSGGKGGYRLYLQDDGNLVIYKSDLINYVWSSKTHGWYCN